MPTLGPIELVIILAVVLILFGPGRLADLGGSVGKSIREFRSGVRDDSESSEAQEAESN